MNKLETLSDTEKYPPPDPKTYEFDKVPLDDPRIYEMISKGDCGSIFQLESQLGKQWAKRLKPQNIHDLAALNSLLRPGGIESKMIDKFCNIKNGLEEPSYIHPSLEPILSKTHSVLVLQEQILEICSKIAGFTETQADDARKAIGHKLPEEMVKVKKLFIEGCEKQNIVNKDIAEEIFSWIQKSVRYLLNGGHAYSYAHIAYFTAYSKYWFPTQFFCSYLIFSSEKPDPKEEINNLVQDARLHNIEILPPDLREKNIDFKIIGEKKIIFGLSHIRGIGGSSIKNIENVNIGNLIEFVKSIKKLKKNVSEGLVKSGALDYLKIERIMLLRCIYAVMGRKEKDTLETLPEVKPLTDIEYQFFIKSLDKTNNILTSLQEIINEEVCIKHRIPVIEAKIKYLEDKKVDSNSVKSLWENLYLGINISCSKVDDVEKLEKDAKDCKFALLVSNFKNIGVYAVIEKIEDKITGDKAKTPGQKFSFLTISDNSGQIKNIPLWPENYQQYRHLLNENSVIYIKLDKYISKDQERFNVREIKVLD